MRFGPWVISQGWHHFYLIALDLPELIIIIHFQFYWIRAAAALNTGALGYKNDLYFSDNMTWLNKLVLDILDIDIIDHE